MKLVTLRGESPVEALRKARNEFGDDTLVKNTKEVAKSTSTQSAIYEVLLLVEDELAEKYQAKQSAMSKDKNTEDSNKPQEEGARK